MIFVTVPKRCISSKTNSRQARQQTSRGLRIPTFLYHVYKNLPWNPLLCRLTAVSSGTPYFYNMIHCDNIVPRTPKSRKWSIPLFFRITFCRLSHFFRACFMPRLFSSIHMWRYNPLWALASLKRNFRSSLAEARLLHRIPRTCVFHCGRFFSFIITVIDYSS